MPEIPYKYLKDEHGTIFYPMIGSSSFSKGGILDYIYPVGSIYMSTVSTSPAVLFGGTWTQLEDTFLLAAGSAYTAGSTGGEAEHTLTTNEMPSHRHSLLYGDGSINDYVAGSTAEYGLKINGTTLSGNFLSATGGDQAHNNMPPYLAVYMWERTA